MRFVSFYLLSKISKYLIYKKNLNFYVLFIYFQVYNVLLERTKCIPGAKVEDNKFCISVHFRCVEEKVHFRILFSPSFASMDKVMITNSCLDFPLTDVGYISGAS